MRITLLGTGSADGWPNAFCLCASCEAMRATDATRAPSSALIDNRVLIDCGPTTPHAIGRAGASLAEVEHVLITHGHPDHLHPAFLLSHQWAHFTSPLHVWGPQHAIDMCRDWIGPDSNIELHVVGPMSEWGLLTQTGEYRCQATSAAHGHGNGDILADEALLYSLTAPDESRLLYATDTGVLGENELDQLRGRFDVVLVDETFGDKHDHGTGHLDLSTLPVLLAELRGRECIDDGTTVVATHLSHHNPEPGALRLALSQMGVHIVDDLSTIDSARGVGGQKVLITGGARSGKSTYAESIAARFPTVDYVATGYPDLDDAHWADRIRLHRERRPPHWRTHETLDIGSVLAQAPANGAVIVDCLSLWLTRTLDTLGAWEDLAFGEQDVQPHIDALSRALASTHATVLLVTNEVGMGVVPETASGRLFRDCLGRLNARMATRCDDVVLMVSGRATILPRSTGQFA